MMLYFVFMQLIHHLPDYEIVPFYLFSNTAFYFNDIIRKIYCLTFFSTISACQGGQFSADGIAACACPANFNLDATTNLCTGMFHEYGVTHKICAAVIDN